MKSILKIEGIKTISKKQQSKTKGGVDSDALCGKTHYPVFLAPCSLCYACYPWP